MECILYTSSFIFWSEYSQGCLCKGHIINHMKGYVGEDGNRWHVYNISRHLSFSISLAVVILVLPNSGNAVTVCVFSY